MTESNRHALPSERYYSEFLTREDSAALGPLIENLGNVLDRISPSVILAVGSSTFPKEFWIDRRQLSYRNRSIPVSYSDIDAVIVPLKPCTRKRMISNIRQALDEGSVPHYLREDICIGAGASIHRANGRAILFPYNEYGPATLIVPLSTGMKLEIIVRDGDVKRGASAKIEEEKLGKSPFSLIYATTA